MITIYHNPRCSKSRQGLAIVEASGKQYEIVKYLDEPISEEKLSEIIKTLGIQPIDLVRKNESIWKEHYKGKDLSPGQVIAAMAKYPKLMERPIVVHGKKAVVGRPPESISEIL